jgi:hypothetical protein
MNLDWYLDKISGRKDTSDTAPPKETLFKINRIDVQNGRFALLNHRSAPSGIPIDFSKLRVDSVYGTVEDLTVANDSTVMHISDLEFIESNGFIIKKMDAKLKVSDGNIIFRNVHLESDSSIINSVRIALYPDSLNGFSNFLSEARLDIDIGKSIVASSDIRHFVTFFKGYNESLALSGRVSGTISELKGRSIRIQYKDETSIDCDFDLSGLPDIDNTFIFLEINDFRSVSGDIEQVNIPGKGKIILPEVLRKLGVVSFTGTFTGFTTDFVAYGKINTDKGLITTDVSLRPEGNNRFRIKGLIKGSGIDIGRITENSGLFGAMTMQANVDGYTESFKKLSVSLTANIDSTEINRYMYRNIALIGSFNNKAWDGSIKVQDENLSMDLLGMFDFNRELPEFDFTLNLKHANRYRLNID